MKRGDPSKPCVVCGLGKQRAWAATCSPQCGSNNKRLASGRFMTEPVKQRGFKVHKITAEFIDSFQTGESK